MTEHSEPKPLVRRRAIAVPAGRTAEITPAMAASLLMLTDSALKLGTRIVAGPGAGKSRLMGRGFARQALFRGRPQVILDPTGGVVANLVDAVRRLPDDIRPYLWHRIVYVDVAATDYVVPTPLYYRANDTETLFQGANRFPAVIRRQDPQLQSASIMGWNSLYECAQFAGQIAIAAGSQVDFVADLVRSPRDFKDRLRHLLELHPELAPAVSYFRELMDPTNGNLRDRRTSSFLNKLLPFRSDPTMLAAFATNRPGIDWDAIVREGRTVIVDFQNEHDPDRRQFKMIWWFRNIIDYVKRRGLSGRGHEILFQIDEITQLLGMLAGDGASVLAEDLEELIAVLGRNMGVNVVIAHQNLTQIPERIRNILMMCGNQLIGDIRNEDDKLYLARQFIPYRPYWVKKEERVWMGVQEFLPPAVPTVIDMRYVEFTPEEQTILAAERFHLPRFHFLARIAENEGNVSRRLRHVSIENLDRYQYPDQLVVDEILSGLRRKCGVSMQALLAEIHAYRREEIQPAKIGVKSADAPGILDTSFRSSHVSATDLPGTGDSDTTLHSTNLGTDEAGERTDDGFWR